MATKAELEETVKTLRADLAKSTAEVLDGIVTPALSGNRQSGETEFMYSVNKTSLTEIKVEKCTVVDGRIVEREFLAEDIGAIAKSKLWKSIYELTQGRKKKNEESNINQQKSNTGENDESDTTGEQTDNGKGSETAGNPSGHEEPGRSAATADDNSPSSEDGNVASGSSSEHSSSSGANRVDGERDRQPVI